MKTPILVLAISSTLVCVSTATRADAPAAVAGRLPVREIGGRLVARCELSTAARRIPANLFVDYDRAIGLELHDRAADGLEIDPQGGTPITLHCAGLDIVVAYRDYGEDPEFAEFTRLHSEALGETALVGAIGADLLGAYHVVFDLTAGFVFLSTPRDLVGTAPPKTDGAALAAISIVDHHVWFPVELADGTRFALAFGTSNYDSTIDAERSRVLGHPAGDVGSVRFRELDLARYVAWRPAALDVTHSDGALGVTGLNLLQHFRVEIDRTNRTIALTEVAPAKFPDDDLAFFQALVAPSQSSFAGFLDRFPRSRRAREAADELLKLCLAADATAAELERALIAVDQTRRADLRATEALQTVKTLVALGRQDAAVHAGRLGIKNGRKDRHPESVHRLHALIGEILLDAGRKDDAWEHLLSAAFGLPEDGRVNLQLGRYYESEGRYPRALSRYLQAVVTPEAGADAVAALERLQRALPASIAARDTATAAPMDAASAPPLLSVDDVDRMIAGKVRNFGAATRFETTADNSTNRVVLAEFFTNAHLGRRLDEGWQSFGAAGAMAIEGLLSHFPRERLVVLSYHIDAPEPTALQNELAARMAEIYQVTEPTLIKINGIHDGPGAGRTREAEAMFERNRRLVVEELLRPAEFTIEGAASVDGDRLTGSVTVRGAAGATADVQLVLAERGVLYPGKAQVVVHRRVARATLTDSPLGLPYSPQNGEMVIGFERSLTAVTTKNEEYLVSCETKSGRAATRLSTRLDSRQLFVVAIVRDRVSHAVLQASQIDVTLESPKVTKP
ncbi:MAG: hypothetical protein ACKVX7_09020 [Planctomycetota bacterium]